MKTYQTCGLELNTPDNGNLQNVPLCIDCNKRNNGSSSIGEHLNSSDAMAGSSPHIKLQTRNDGTDGLDASSEGEENDNHCSLPLDDSDVVENAAENTIPSFLSDEENNSHWMLPEPEYPEQDRYSVANNDDDDDFNDGTPWCQSISLTLDEDPSNHRTRKEERQEAMMLVKNGEFRDTVYQHLENVMGLANPEIVMNWRGIVTSLSWDAAMLIKPEPDVAMDPGCYLKVKCVASGSRSDSQVLKGLVFNKNTAHKHMPSNLTEIARCHSFLIKKFEEDLECVGTDGRKPSKTLMLVEGCPRPLGCTILLRGASRDELKNV